MFTFSITWSIPQEQRIACWNSFGKMTPADDLADHGEKIKMIGRWHNMSGSGGVCIAETDDMTALSSWMLTWSPVCDIKCEPIVNDEVARANIQSKPFFLNA